MKAEASGKSLNQWAAETLAFAEWFRYLLFEPVSVPDTRQTNTICSTAYS
jgi:hypothetical protein